MSTVKFVLRGIGYRSWIVSGDIVRNSADQQYMDLDGVVCTENPLVDISNCAITEIAIGEYQYNTFWRTMDKINPVGYNDAEYGGMPVINHHSADLSTIIPVSDYMWKRITK